MQNEPMSDKYIEVAKEAMPFGEWADKTRGIYISELTREQMIELEGEWENFIDNFILWKEGIVETAISKEEDVNLLKIVMNTITIEEYNYFCSKLPTKK